MARKTFYSFHYVPDAWRAGQVRSMGVVDGNVPAADNDWETVTKGGDVAIANWIANQMNGRSCTVVLAGAQTAGRKWIKHEIIESWNAKMGVLAIHIDMLKDTKGLQSLRGANPLSSITLKSGTVNLSSVATCHVPPYTDSARAYSYIKTNLPGWIEDAIKIRADYK